jgi:hypothetical protein
MSHFEEQDVAMFNAAALVFLLAALYGVGFLIDPREEKGKEKVGAVHK